MSKMRRQWTRKSSHFGSELTLDDFYLRVGRQRVGAAFFFFFKKKVSKQSQLKKTEEKVSKKY